MPKMLFHLALSVFLTATIFAFPGFSHTARQEKAATAPLVVSFGSECCGINRKAFEKLERFVKAFEKSHKVKIASERRHWGKEGEFDVIFPLTGIGAPLKIRFKAEVRAALKDERLVTVR